MKGQSSKVEAICQECGVTFLVYPARLAEGNAKFCGTRCYGLSRRGARRDTSGWVRGPEERVCRVCGKPFLIGGRQGKSRGQYMCSIECQRIARYRRAVQATAIAPLDAAYLAGFIDGEGSVFLYMRRDVAAVRLGASNTNKAVLDWILAVTGVGHVQRGRAGGASHKQAWWWQVNGEGAETVLRQIRPHMKLKTVQADLAIETQERLRDPALKADRAWQRDYWLRMKALNQRGPVPA